ncbi:MAG: acyltransferase [Candidatus Aenigmarchaeota archaeon]|nr:acyltransferase [Candidatus Aenigmarchaeota archaeon]
MAIKIFKNRMFKSCGSGVRIYGKSTITGAEDMEIGDNVVIAEGAWIAAKGGLIVDNTKISRNVTIYSNSHVYEGGLLPFDENLILKHVTICENVWIGMNVNISPGTQIGEGVIIALGVNVHGEIPPLAIVGDNCKILKYRDKEHYFKLKRMKAFCGEFGLPLRGKE